MKTRRLTTLLPLHLGLLAVWLALAGCTSVSLIAGYDQKIDEGVTALQKRTGAFLVKLERTCQTPEGSYAQNLSFYDEAKVELSALQSRAAAIPQNKLTSDQLALLQDSYDKLEAQHKRGFTPLVVAETRKLLDSQFTSILTLELAKQGKP